MFLLNKDFSLMVQEVVRGRKKLKVLIITNHGFFPAELVNWLFIFSEANEIRAHCEFLL